MLGKAFDRLKELIRSGQFHVLIVFGFGSLLTIMLLVLEDLLSSGPLQNISL